MALDFLRSCYKASWRFFPEAPGALVRGRYFFVDDDTAMLPYPNLFTSGVWDSEDEETPRVLGEVKETGRQWDRGNPPPNLPPQAPLGTAAEWAADQDAATLPENRRFYGGIPAACWLQHGLDLADALGLYESDSTCWRLALARCIELLYDEQEGPVNLFFAQWLGADTVCHHFPDQGLFPRMCFVESQGAIVCLFPGTVSFQQLALQALQFGQGPQPHGAFTCADLHFQAAILAAERMLALNLNPALPLLVAGHSYGGALAQLLALRCALGDPGRKIGVCTFGMPKPAGKGWQALYAPECEVHLQCVDDPIPSLPPTLGELIPFLWFVSLALAEKWDEWTAPRLVTQLADGGQQTPGPPVGVAPGVLVPFLLSSLAGQPAAPVHAHGMDTYRRRLEKGCQIPHWPFDGDMWETLFGKRELGPFGVMIGGGGGAGKYLPTDGGVLIGGAGGDGEYPAAAGGLVMGGKSIVAPPPSPGSTCALAWILMDPHVFLDDLAAGTYWFRFVMEPGTDFSIKVGLPFGSFATVYQGADCGSLSAVGLIAGGCADFNLSGDPNIFLEVSIAGGGVSLIEWAPFPC